MSSEPKPYRVWFPVDPEYMDEMFGFMEDGEQAWLVVSVQCRSESAAAVLACSMLAQETQELLADLSEADIFIEEVEEVS